MLNKRIRHRVFFYLRLIFGLFLLLIVVKFVDFEQLLPILTSPSPYLLAAGLLGIMLGYLLKTYRWASILWIQNPDISFSKLVRFYFMSAFLANFIPTTVSSDIMKIYCTSKYTSDLKGVMSAVFLDRVIGCFSLAIIAMIAFLVVLQTDIVITNTAPFYWILACLLAGIGTLVATQNSVVVNKIGRILQPFRKMALLKLVCDMYEYALIYRTQHTVMVKVLSISLVIYSNRFKAVPNFRCVFSRKPYGDSNASTDFG